MIVATVGVMSGGGGAPGEIPVASFIWTPADTPAFTNVQFLDTSTNNPTSWSWKLNGGEFSIQQNPSYYFSIPGDFNISLTATNAKGSNTFSTTLRIDRP